MTLWFVLVAAVGMIALGVAANRQQRNRPSAQHATTGSDGGGYIPAMDSGGSDCATDGGADGGGCGDGGGGGGD